ncbi:type VI secretion protein [Rahnella woolbedingensis]|uniref:Type VI secretion protein n=1 Tax=Rahnella woolbedingensis TaxID=1510574 RepID=A0A419NAT6_9GAMM|nr:type VI secretion protein [Rahnella woolbedingensis]RJT45066.1 type VI secretion protein [Rahnella woolbedingensis]
MGWERQKPFTTEQPSPPSSGGWLISGVLAVIAGVLLFVLHASGTLSVLKVINIWLFALLPVVLWILIFSTCGYLYGRKMERFQFFQREAEHAQQQWTAWAERYIAISASCVMLPDSISAALLQQSLRGLTQQQGLVRRIDHLKGNQAVMNALLQGIQGALQNLPAELALQVTVLTDEPESGRQKLYALFDECWQVHAPANLRPSSLNITDRLPFQFLDERLGQPESTVQLILVMQMNGDTRYSDGLAALLFTTDDVAKKHTLHHPVRVLRPMPLDVSDLSEELTLLLTTQTQACQTISVLGDHQKWTESSATLISTGNALGTRWQAENILTIETYCGIQGPFSPWFTLALGADFVHIGQQSWLALSTTGAENFVYTITSGSGDERIK